MVDYSFKSSSKEQTKVSVKKKCNIGVFGIQINAEAKTLQLLKLFMINKKNRSMRSLSFSTRLFIFHHYESIRTRFSALVLIKGK